jgi:hypothetical protein
MRIRFVVLAGVLLLISVVQLEAQGARAELLASDRKASGVSSDSGLVAVLSTALSPRGVLLWPGAPVVVGPDQAKRLLLTLPARDSFRLTWQPLGVELSTDSTLGITWGVAAITSRMIPNAPHLGRYTAAWQRESGRWSISALLFMNVQPIADHVPPGIPVTRSPVSATGPAGPFVAADLAFARLARDSGAVLAFRTWASPDAIVAGGSGLLARGPDVIANGVAGPAVWRWHPVAAGASARGDLGWTAGEAVIAPENGDTSFSKYLTVWLRPQGQPIRFLTDGGNPRPAGPSSVRHPGS